ncbi:MAG: hypothetical protein DWQ02_02525 [Bacteroidetes bacterium]|nr:MAG: hypothetical protein DWQ02_02525 [Bacteroidota bacterium]
MKNLSILAILFFIIPRESLTQNTFSWNDSKFYVGQSRNIKLERAFDGPCTVRPCYDYGNNKQTYDTLITF